MENILCDWGCGIILGSVGLLLFRGAMILFFANLLLNVNCCRFDQCLL